MRITNVKRNYNDKENIEKIIFSMLETQLEEKIEAMYNQQQADTVAQNSNNSEGRVA